MLTSDYLDSRRGGVEQHVYYLARQMKLSGHEVTVLRVSPDKPLHRVPEDVPCVYFRPRLASWAAKIARRLPGIVGETLVRLSQNLDARHVHRTFHDLFAQCDVVHQHDFLANNRLTRRIACEVPVVWTNHLGETLLLNRYRFGRYALRRLTRHYSSVVAPSDELAEASGVPVGAVTRITNGVDEQAFVSGPERTDCRRERGFSEDEIVILVPRRWSPTKGVDVLARALQLIETSARVRVIFVGASSFEYPSHARLVQQLLSSARVPVEVLPLAPAEAMIEWYSAADVVVIPSRLEATSLAALEAMAAECVVVASNVGGLPEVIEQDVTGFLIPPDDPAQLASVLEKVIALSPAERAVVGKAARRRVVDQGWTWSAVAERMFTLYTSAANAGSRGEVKIDAQ